MLYEKEIFGHYKEKMELIHERALILRTEKHTIIIQISSLASGKERNYG